MLLNLDMSFCRENFAIVFVVLVVAVVVVVFS